MTNDEKIAYCHQLVFNHFKGDRSKVQKWFNTRNPLLGRSMPANMIKNGRVDKLLGMIQNALEGNRP